MIDRQSMLLWGGKRNIKLDPSLKDDPRSGRPLRIDDAGTVKKVKDFILLVQTAVIQLIFKETQPSYDTCVKIIHELHMTKAWPVKWHVESFGVKEWWHFCSPGNYGWILDLLVWSRDQSWARSRRIANYLFSLQEGRLCCPFGDCHKSSLLTFWRRIRPSQVPITEYYWGNCVIKKWHSMITKDHYFLAEMNEPAPRNERTCSFISRCDWGMRVKWFVTSALLSTSLSKLLFVCP